MAPPEVMKILQRVARTSWLRSPLDVMEWLRPEWCRNWGNKNEDWMENLINQSGLLNKPARLSLAEFFSFENTSNHDSLKIRQCLINDCAKKILIRLMPWRSCWGNFFEREYEKLNDKANVKKNIWCMLGLKWKT